MRRVLIVLVALVALTGGLLWIFREPILLELAARQVAPDTVEDRIALVAPASELRTPEGEGPFATVVMFHGCSGVWDGNRYWADEIVEAGYAAYLVDSHTPRGIDRDRAIAEVCQGKLLIGQERAGDVVAALRHVVTLPQVDPDRIAVAGWSHGAWTLMDLFSMELGEDDPPPNMSGTRPGDLAAVQGALLFYPWCGIGALSDNRGWSRDIPVLAFVGGDDRIVEGPQCRKMLADLAEDGAPVKTAYYPDADHVFDVPPPGDAYVG